MTNFTADVSNLDSATRDYLAEVAREKGRGAPGVFVAGRTNAWPVVSLIVGVIVLFVGLLLAMAAPKAPWATALLVTAVVLLGGWMALYPLRRWFGGGLGSFQYFDPLAIYQSSGREVTVTDIREVSNLNVVEHFNQGSYQHTNLTFRIPGKPCTVAVTARNRADLIANYYANVMGLREEESIRDAAELGATAKYMAKEGERPGSARALDLSIATVPESPSATKTTGFALRFLIIVGVTAAIFAVSWLMLSPLQDNLVYEQAGQHGVQGYRDYLLDVRHTRHRDEAKAKIAEYYQPLIQRIKTVPDASERQGWTEMLEDLSQFEGLPVVSIAVVEEGGAADAETRQNRLRTWLADSIGSHFGPAYVAFVQAPEGVKPHLEVSYRRDPFRNTVSWQTRFRRTPESEPVVGPLRTSADPGFMNFPSPNLQSAFFQQSFAVPVPMIHAAPVSGGDFE